MPQPNTANFYSPGFDYSAELADIERRKKLSESLQQQADLPFNQQMVGDRAIKFSPWQGLANMAKQYNANKYAEQAIERQQKLSEKAQRDLTNVLTQGSEAYTGRPARTIQPDPQEAQQSADQGTPDVPAVNQAAVAPDLNRAASIYMSHPQTAPLGMSMAQQDITTKQQLARALAATGVDTGGAAQGVAAAPGAQPSATPSSGTTPTSVQPSPAVPPQPGAQAPQQPPQGGQFDRNGVPIDFSRSLQVSDPSLAKYWDYVKQLREPKMSANGQVMQYQQLPNGGWGYAPGAGAVDAARAFADVGEQARAAQDIVTVQENGRPVQMTRAEAVRRFGQGAQAQASPPPASLPRPQTGFQRVQNVPPQDEAALRFVEEQAAKGLPASAYGGAPQAPQTGFGVGQTPGEKTFEEGSATNATKYRGAINERVAVGQDLMMRIGESEGLLKQFQAGGGQGVRVQLAQMAQAVGAPQATVDGLARGDLGSAQAFQKIVVSQAMEALKQAMATSGGTGAGRITQAEFQIFMKANPNLELDPRALEKIYGFAKQVHARDYAEQQGFQTWINEKKDPAAFQAHWAQQIHNQGVKDIVNSGANEDPLGIRRRGVAR